MQVVNDEVQLKPECNVEVAESHVCNESYDENGVKLLCGCTLPCMYAAGVMSIDGNKRLKVWGINTHHVAKEESIIM